MLRKWELGEYKVSGHTSPLHSSAYTDARNMTQHPVLFVAGRKNQDWLCSTFFFSSLKFTHSSKDDSFQATCQNKGISLLSGFLVSLPSIIC